MIERQGCPIKKYSQQKPTQFVVLIPRHCLGRQDPA